jgi:hypothetical protein
LKNSKVDQLPRFFKDLNLFDTNEYSGWLKIGGYDIYFCVRNMHVYYLGKFLVYYDSCKCEYEGSCIYCKLVNSEDSVGTPGGKAVIVKPEEVIKLLPEELSNKVLLLLNLL